MQHALSKRGAAPCGEFVQVDTRKAPGLYQPHDRGYAYKPVGALARALESMVRARETSVGGFDQGDLQHQSLLLPKHHLYRRQHQLQTTETFLAMFW